MYELINADTLTNWLCAHPETLDDYAEKYGAIVKTLHETEADTAIFGNIKDLYNKWADDMLVQDGELLFIDMADLTYGHRIFDYAGMALTHIMAGPYVKYVTGIDNDMAEKLYFSVLKASFPGRTEDELAQIHQVIMGYAGIKYAISPAVNKNQDPQTNARVVGKAKEQIIPNAKKLIGAIRF